MGAGPGDPGLVTLRAVECIGRADVVVYDRLVGPETLRHARQDAELIYCGKEAGRHALSQDEINALLVEKALEGKRVCRLKGGDPIVFGRGAEEALELRRHDVPFEIVPGVTSAIAAGAYAGIPVTLRGVASSFAVATGHEDPGKPEGDVNWRALAACTDTLVILMGVGNLDEIVGELVAGGRPPSTPIAFVSWATWPQQRTVVSTLEGAVAEAQAQRVQPPTVMIVGEVVRAREHLAWFDSRPLSGRRVLVTRTRQQAGELSRALEQLGAQAVEMPVIRIVPPEDWAPLDAAVDAAESYQWLVLTSSNGARALGARLRERGRDIRALRGPRVAAIGPGTAKAAEGLGLRVDLCPPEFVAESLAAALLEQAAPGDGVLIVRAAEARDVLPQALTDGGLLVTVAPAYRTLPADELDRAAIEALEAGEIDVVTFASSSSVRFFVDSLGAARARSLLERTLVACIGPVTARAAEECGLRVSIAPDEFTIEALVAAISEHFQSDRRDQG